MKCLRCNAKMKHYELEKIFNIYGAKHKPTPFSNEIQKPHNPRSVFICDECGYVEFSMKECEEPDI